MILQQHAWCQAAASAMEAAGLHVLAHALRFTARQEAEQSAILHAFVPEDAPVPAPGPLPEAPDAILLAAIAREEASAHRLREAADQLHNAGQDRAAHALSRIAETEGVHAQRFRQCLQSLEDGSLLRSPRRVSWFCLACGALHHGCEAPSSCEGCGGSRGHFVRSSFEPLACR